MAKTPVKSTRSGSEGDLETLGYVIHRGVVDAEACRRAAAAAHRVICVDDEGDSPSATEPGRIWQPHLRAEWAAVAQQVLEAVHAGGGSGSLELSQLQVRTLGGEGEPWHQDPVFFGRPDDLASVLWIALTRLAGASGLHVQPASHTDPIHAHRDEPVVSTQGRKAIEALPDRPSEALELEPGDVLVFLPNLIHRVAANHTLPYTAAIVGYLARWAP